MSLRHREVCDAARPEHVEGTGYEVPQLIWQRAWTDSDGTVWRARGQDALEPRRARKLLERPDVRVMHIYDGDVHEHAEDQLRGLIEEIEAYWAGDADPMASFQLREFRSEQHAAMVLIQESC